MELFVSEKAPTELEEFCSKQLTLKKAFVDQTIVDEVKDLPHQLLIFWGDGSSVPIAAIDRNPDTVCDGNGRFAAAASTRRIAFRRIMDRGRLRSC